MGIAFKLTSFFVTVATVVITISSYIFFVSARQAIEQRTFSHLESVAILKENQLRNFINEKSIDMQSLANDTLLIKAVLEDRGFSESRVQDTNVHKNIRNILAMRLIMDSDFTTFYFLAPEGVIEVGTDTSLEGKIRSSADYFINGKNATFIHNFHYDLASQEPSALISTPIKDHENNLIGVLVGIINIEKISGIITERAGLGETGETYLVNKFNLLLTKSRFVEDVQFKKSIYTKTVKECLKGNSGGIYDFDYRETATINFYVWAPDIEVCIVAGVTQKEAFGPINKLLGLIVLIGIFLIIFSTFISLLLSISIADPIIKLGEISKKVGEGELDTKIEIKSKDEIGELCKNFNLMTSQLKESKKKIEKYSYKLEGKVKTRTKELNKKVVELQKTRTAVLKVMDDLDESNKKLLETQGNLNKKLRELKRLDKEKDKFISIAAHELKTPMTAIHGFAQLFENEKIIQNPQLREKYFGIMKQEISRLSELVTDVLDLSRADLGSIKLDLRYVDVAQVVTEVKDTLELKASKKNLKVYLNIEPNLPKVKTDREHLKRILINLVDNSIKYTIKGHVKISARLVKRDILFDISDTGIGIPKKHFDRIFKRFFQVETPYREKASGSGLGLSICKELVQTIGGKIWFESKVDKGTTFYFTLPLDLKIKKKR